MNTLVGVSVTATNNKGDSTPSIVNTSGARIRVVPEQMDPPTNGIASDDDTIQVNWNALSEPDDGYSTILTYKLIWNAGNVDGSNNPVDPTITLTNSNVLTYTVTGLTAGTEYLFQVQASNIYGFG